MEVGFIILLFISNALGLDCLYKCRYKWISMIFIFNLCATVALAYQFQQMEKIVHLFMGAVVMVIAFFIVKIYINKKRTNQIEEKD